MIIGSWYVFKSSKFDTDNWLVSFLLFMKKIWVMRKDKIFFGSSIRCGVCGVLIMKMLKTKNYKIKGDKEIKNEYF